jgi:uncharacterized membrane protein SpoIIM required for sporulation
MKQKQFEQQHEALWSQIDAILADKSTQLSAPDVKALPQLYRRLCQSLALALQRGYSPSLTDYLQKQVADCHRRLYGVAIERPLTLRHWMLVVFPRLVREEWRLLALAMLAFWGVGIGVGLLVWFEPQWAYAFFEPEKLDSMERMYRSPTMKVGRGSEGDMLMFGHYIWNNVSIDFRTFAGGVMGGVPALLSVAFNGLHFGVVAAWLSKDPVTRDALWSFVATHSSFEVTGLLLSAVAGMRLGLSLISPGRLSRRHALYAASQRMFPMIVGAALLTVLAAFFEAFWSADPRVQVAVKYGVAAVCWSSIVLFFTLAGRRA